MSPPRLEITSLRKSFGPTDVLADVSLSVQPGQFVSILGPSGAGKSTILQLLTGAITPDAGRVLFDGQPLCANRHRFAFMPQGDALMPWRRIIDNTTLGLEVEGLSRGAARARVAPLFAEFGLAGFEDHYPAQLSGGMRQREAVLLSDRIYVLSSRPARIAHEFAVSLNHPRRGIASPALAAMEAEILQTLLNPEH